MKMLQRLAAAGVAVSLLTLLTGCGQRVVTNENGERVYQVNVVNTVGEQDPTNLAWDHFEQLMEERSNGRFQVQIFSSGSIAGSDRDVLDQVQSGNVQMGNTMPGLFADLSGIEDYYVFNLPYLINTEEELREVCSSDHFTELNEQFREMTGVRIYADSAYVMGWYGFGSANTQLESVDDLKGLKLRVNDVYQVIEFARLIGLNPVFISMGEVYTAIQQGLVDGMMTPTTLFWSNGYYEVLSSVLMTKHGGSFHQIVVNDEWYQELPEDLQVILDECILEMSEYEREIAVPYLDECISNMNANGCTVYEISEEDTEYMRSLAEEEIYRNKDAALVNYEVIQMVQDMLAQ